MDTCVCVNTRTFTAERRPDDAQPAADKAPI